MIQRVVGALIFLAVVTFTVTAYADGSRGLTVPLKVNETKDAAIVEEVQLYSKSYALVIGIDEYQHWPRLSNGVKDAKLVATALEEHGFDVTLKLNLNSNDLQTAFQEFFVFKGADPEARIFVWFAGHGHTQNGEGYLIPADAPLASEGPKFRFTALSLRRFGEYVRQAESKHAFSIFDSCFSGTIFETARSSPPPAITKVTTAPVRQFLSSGDSGQEVSDDGTFRRMFVEAIAGKRRADANGDGYLTASELGLFLTDSVTNYSNRRQTPRYGKLNDPDFDRGDFVFKLASVGPKQGTKRSVQVGTVDKETVFWQSILNSTDANDYEAYLEQFPNGTFATLAKSMLAKLDSAASPPGRYVSAGELACHGGAQYPEAWRENSDCMPFGCYIGKMSKNQCLEQGQARGAKEIIHGRETGDRSNECWLQNSCADLRQHLGFNRYLYRD